MRCPKCGHREMEVQVTFSGTVDLTWSDAENFEVTDSEPTGSEWDDNSDVRCFECGYQGSASEFTLAELIAEEDFVHG